MKYFKKVKQFIKIANNIRERFENDIEGKDGTIFYRYIELFSLYNHSNYCFFTKKEVYSALYNIEPVYKAQQLRRNNMHLNKYINSIIKVMENSTLEECVVIYNDAIVFPKAEFHYEPEVRIVDILSEEQKQTINSLLNGRNSKRTNEH